MSNEDFPVSLILRFKSEREKRIFMGGLSDGFGENVCSLEHDAPFDECHEFRVELLQEILDVARWHELVDKYFLGTLTPEDRADYDYYDQHETFRREEEKNG